MGSQIPMSGDKLCPSCGRQWPHTAARCTCGHQFPMMLQQPMNPNTGQTQQFTQPQPTPINHPQQHFHQQPFVQQPVPIIVSCPRCRVQVWSTFVACPNCGMDLQTKPPDKYLIAGMWSGLAVPIVLGFSSPRLPFTSALGGLGALGGFIVAIILVCRSNRVERTNGAVFLGLIALFLLAAMGNRG